MKKNDFINRAQVFFLGMILLVSGCGSPSMWYKTGHNQVDFDLDNHECQRIAEEVGRQASITGEKIDLDVFSRSYNNCLFSRGWTHTPPGSEPKNISAAELADIQGNLVTVFDQELTIPSGYHLVNNKIVGFQDVRQQTLFYQSDDLVFLNIVIQKTFSRTFDPVDYPAAEPYFVYDKGGNESDCLVNWTVFSGEDKGNLVVGIGAYYIVEENQRISIIMTRATKSTNEDPPAGLRLTKNQKTYVDDFSGKWLGKVKTAFGSCR